MKVLAIAGSPRVGGNSEIICDEFLKGAAAAGHETEKINAAKKNIAPCMGCDACKKIGSCVQKDDMAEIIDKLMVADVILLAAPVYFYSVCAQMKTLIDRCYVKYTEIKNKKFYLAVTAAAPSPAEETTLADFRGFLRCLPQSEELGVFNGTGNWAKGDIKGKAVLEEAYNAGKNL